MNSDFLKPILQGQLQGFRVPSARVFLQKHLKEPYEVAVPWFVPSDPAPKFWCVAELPNGTRILYCSPNRERTDPWVVLSVDMTHADGDDHWFLTLEDSFYQSGAWNGELPPGYEVS